MPLVLLPRPDSQCSYCVWSSVPGRLPPPREQGLGIPGAPSQLLGTWQVFKRIPELKTHAQESSFLMTPRTHEGRETRHNQHQCPISIMSIMYMVFYLVFNLFSKEFTYFFERQSGQGGEAETEEGAVAPRNREPEAGLNP